MSAGAHGTDERASPQSAVCASCGSSVQPAWRHCGECGFRLTEDHVPEREHAATVVVSDLQGSTALAETLDPESLRLVLDHYFAELGEVLESYGGRIEKRIGDAMVTVFGLPEARPDDAERAVRAAAESQATLAELNIRLEAGWGVRLTNRTGVASGTVVYATGGGVHRVLAGAALELATGLEPLAPPLGILVTAATAALLGDHAELGPAQTLRLKGGQIVDAHDLLAIDAGADRDERIEVDRSRCGGCGAIADRELAWCIACGVPRAGDSQRLASRRTLTIVFVDLAVHHERDGVDASADRAATLQAFEAARSALVAHGGSVEHFIGDAVMAVFGLAQRHEDDALRAIRAALDVQDRLRSIADGLARHGVRVTARIGVNTGPVIAGDPAAGERLVTGDAVNVAARLEQTAAPGDVVIGELTRVLAGPSVTLERLAPLTLKGKAEPVPAHLVLGVRNVASTAGRFELPLLGREAEATVIRDAFRRSVADQNWQRVRVRGDAGIGKSRLVHELVDEIGDRAQLLRGTCLPYGEGITFWPIAEIIRSAAGLDTGSDADGARRAIDAISPEPDVAVRLHSLLGLDQRPVPVPELVWAVRRLFGHLAHERPVVVVVDGLQWAEPTLVELLDDVIANPEGGSLLLLTMERGQHGDEPGGTDDAGTDDPASADASGRSVVLDLAPLDESTCDDLITGAIGRATLPETVRQHIVRTAAGLPLFVEQVITMLIDDGRLVHEAGSWRAATTIDDVKVPPTIEALLAARIDALTADEVAVIEPASVIGREFPIDAVERLRASPVDAATLAALDRRQLIGTLAVPHALADHRFRNLLIRDVVYDGLLKRSRAALHERLADWMLGGVPPERIIEVEEIIGYHLERAFVLGAEVAAVDDAAVAIGRRASAHLGAAGERAFARGDLPAAANLLQRAAHTLHGGGTLAARLLVLAGDAKFETGAFPAAVAQYDEAERLALAAADPATAATAELARVTLRYLTGDGVDDAGAREAADRLLPIFEAHGDHVGTARCWRLRTYIDVFACQWGAAERSVTHTIRYAQQAGDIVLERRVLPGLAGFALYGPTPVPRALTVCNELLERAGTDRRTQSLIQQLAAHLLALGGQFDDARAMGTSARAGLLELGWNFEAALVSIHVGPIELMAGRPDAAERELRRDYDTLHAMGERNYLSTTAYLLAEAVRRQGRINEALDLVAESASIAADDDVFSQIGWRSVRSRALAERGDHDEALVVARQALELVMTTDGPHAQGDVLMDVADALSRAGDIDAAREAAGQAAERFAAKQSHVAERRALGVLAQLSGAN
jgi:class 3 adenylate cyclase/tetratricopeptide (TPR) repeat protein